MSLNWPPKDPDATLDYSVDWSRFLGSDTITSVIWYINDSAGVKTMVTSGVTVNGLTLITQSATSTVAIAVLSAGTLHESYTVTCQVTFGTGNLVVERKIKLPIREQ